VPHPQDHFAFYTPHDVPGLQEGAGSQPALTDPGEEI